ncbi:MAG: hypothetical protein Q4B18_05565 [Bacillota bacterium]|nr:hypothetical protein [Bacillota bacterium]
MRESNVYLKELLQRYNYQLKEQKQELKEMPSGYLAIRNDLKQPTPVWVRRKTTAGGNGKIKYDRKTITDRNALVQQLARKKYLEKSTKLLAEEIERLNKYLKESIEPTADNVLKMLPRSYSALPEEIFFPKQRKANKWAELPYPQNTLYPEEKIHTTGRGLKVRSKSELFIADKLDMYLLPFQYDGIIYFENYAFSPDFMIPTIEGMKYWEHCGKMAESKYRKRNQWKLTMYDKMGIVPWKNLIITYDSEDGGLNLGIIEAEIRNKLIPVRL